MLSRRHCWTALLAAVASALFLEVDPKMWLHEDKAAFSQSKAELFNFVTNHKDIHEWCPVFSSVQARENSSLSKGKVFRAETGMVFTTYQQDFTIVEFNRNVAVTVESDGFLRPVIRLSIAKAEKGRSMLTIGVFYNRKSVLFQCVAAPILKFFTMQHVRHSLFVLNWLLPPKFHEDIHQPSEKNPRVKFA